MYTQYQKGLSMVLLTSLFLQSCGNLAIDGHHQMQGDTQEGASHTSSKRQPSATTEAPPAASGLEQGKARQSKKRTVPPGGVTSVSGRSTGLSTSPAQWKYPSVSPGQIPCMASPVRPKVRAQGNSGTNLSAWHAQLREKIEVLGKTKPGEASRLSQALLGGYQDTPAQREALRALDMAPPDSSSRPGLRGGMMGADDPRADDGVPVPAQAVPVAMAVVGLAEGMRQQEQERKRLQEQREAEPKRLEEERREQLQILQRSLPNFKRNIERLYNGYANGNTTAQEEVFINTLPGIYRLTSSLCPGSRVGSVDQFIREVLPSIQEGVRRQRVRENPDPRPERLRRALQNLTVDRRGGLMGGSRVCNPSEIFTHLYAIIAHYQGSSLKGNLLSRIQERLAEEGSRTEGFNNKGLFPTDAAPSDWTYVSYILLVMYCAAAEFLVENTPQVSDKNYERKLGLLYDELHAEISALEDEFFTRHDPEPTPSEPSLSPSDFVVYRSQLQRIIDLLTHRPDQLAPRPGKTRLTLSPATGLRPVPAQPGLQERSLSPEQVRDILRKALGEFERGFRDRLRRAAARLVEETRKTQFRIHALEQRMIHEAERVQRVQQEFHDEIACCKREMQGKAERDRQEIQDKIDALGREIQEMRDKAESDQKELQRLQAAEQEREQRVIREAELSQRRFQARIQLLDAKIEKYV